MRFGQDQSTSTIGNRGGTWRIATSLLVLTIVLLTASPIATIAQGEGLSTAEVPAEAPAVVEPVVEQPTAVPVQPTAVPPTAVPPTAVPPTAIPTAVPTEIPPTAVPTAVPTQEPTAVPTEKVWVNTDSLRVTNGVTTHTVQQGAAATVSITYTVTTPRSSTTVYARLSGATDGWTISSPQLPDTDPAATTAAWTQTANQQPGTAFNLPIVITAPATVAQDHAVSLHLWSVAAGEKGQETGVTKTDLRIATVTALAPPPTPTPTVVPTIEATEEPTTPPAEMTRPHEEPSVARTSTTVLSATPVSTPMGTTNSKEGLQGSCVLEGQVDVPGQGIAAKIRCDYSGADGKIKLASQANDVPVVPQGWKFGVTETNEPPGSWMSAPNNNAFGQNDAGSFHLYLIPKEGTTLPVTGVLTLRVETTNGNSGFPVELGVILEPAPTTVAPSVSIAPFSFESRTWDGTSWGTTTGTGTIRVKRDKPDASGNYSVQVRISDPSHPGLNPAVVSSSTSGQVPPGLSATDVVADPKTGGMKVASVDHTFSGTGDLNVGFTLTPTNEVPAGPHSITVNVTVINGQ